jgi:hypothetical protein
MNDSTSPQGQARQPDGDSCSHIIFCARCNNQMHALTSRIFWDEDNHAFCSWGCRTSYPHAPQASKQRTD